MRDGNFVYLRDPKRIKLKFRKDVVMTRICQFQSSYREMLYFVLLFFGNLYFRLFSFPTAAERTPFLTKQFKSTMFLRRLGFLRLTKVQSNLEKRNFKAREAFSLQ